MLDSTASNFSDIDPNPLPLPLHGKKDSDSSLSKKRRHSAAKKTNLSHERKGQEKILHNAAERRRKQLFNNKLTELQDLLPSSHSQVKMSKMRILERAVEYTKELLASIATLQETNQQLVQKVQHLEVKTKRIKKKRRRIEKQQIPPIVGNAFVESYKEHHQFPIMPNHYANAYHLEQVPASSSHVGTQSILSCSPTRRNSPAQAMHTSIPYNDHGSSRLGSPPSLSHSPLTKEKFLSSPSPQLYHETFLKPITLSEGTNFVHDKAATSPGKPILPPIRSLSPFAGIVQNYNHNNPSPPLHHHHRPKVCYPGSERYEPEDGYF